MNRKTIDIIRERCNEKLPKKYSGLDSGKTIEDWQIILIIQEYYKLLLEEK